MPYNAPEIVIKKSHTQQMKANDDSHYDIEEIPLHSSRYHDNDKEK